MRVCVRACVCKCLDKRGVGSPRKKQPVSIQQKISSLQISLLRYGAMLQFRSSSPSAAAAAASSPWPATTTSTTTFSGMSLRDIKTGIQKKKKKKKANSEAGLKFALMTCLFTDAFVVVAYTEPSVVLDIVDSMLLFRDVAK